MRQSGIHSRPRDLQSVKAIHEFEQFSHDTQKRNCTDILCIIIGVLFSLIMIIVSFSIYNKQHYIKANFPTDSDGNLCGIDSPGYNYVYFVQPTQIKERVCVKSCPTQNDTKLNCKATSTRGCNFNNQVNFKVQKYNTQPWDDRNGHFCMPTDQNARQQILQQSKLKSRNVFFNSADTYVTCGILSAVLALCFFITVQFIPKLVNKYIIYVGVVMLFILVICTWTYPTQYTKSKIIIGLILIGFLLVVALTSYLFKDAVAANGVFLNQASKLIKEFPLVLLNIPLFLGITVLFTYILILQLNSIWTHSDLIFQNSNSLYWEYKNSQSLFLTFLWIIQAIWGLNFIKQSFNFIVSSYAVLWYNQYIGESGFKKTDTCSIIFFPYRIYITKHFGSVIACAFMSSFFNVFDTIFDLVRGSKKNRGNTICDNLDCFFDLVRSQALPYIAITGNAYCNSARYCEYLCDQSNVLQNSQAASRAYRIAAYSTLSGFVAILGLYIHGQISIFGIGIVIIFSYFIINFFLQIHADTGDAILIVFLQNQQFLCRSFLNNTHKNRADFGRKIMTQNPDKSDGIHHHTQEISQQLEKQELFLDQIHRKKIGIKN